MFSYSSRISIGSQTLIITRVLLLSQGNASAIVHGAFIYCCVVFFTRVESSQVMFIKRFYQNLHMYIYIYPLLLPFETWWSYIVVSTLPLPHIIISPFCLQIITGTFFLFLLFLLLCVFLRVVKWLSRSTVLLLHQGIFVIVCDRCCTLGYCCFGTFTNERKQNRNFL